MLYNALKFIANIGFKLFYKIEVVGKENVIDNKGFLLCANHTHVLDPIILSIIIPRQISWMGKKELFKNRFIAYFLRKLNVFPVNRQETELSTIKHSIRLLNKQEILGIFPEGTRVNEVSLENAKPGVALISIKSKSTILPVYIDGSYRLFSTIKIKIGEPFDFSDRYDDRLDTNEYRLLSQEILQKIYLMK